MADREVASYELGRQSLEVAVDFDSSSGGLTVL